MRMVQKLKRLWSRELSTIPVLPRAAMAILIVLNDGIFRAASGATIAGYRWLQVTYCPCDDCKAERAAKAGGGI